MDIKAPTHSRSRQRQQIAKKIAVDRYDRTDLDEPYTPGNRAPMTP